MARLIKREEISKTTRIKVMVIAILLAFVVAGIFLAILGYEPLSVFGSMIKGSFGSIYRVRQTIIRAIPLVIASIGISVAFKMLFWNIGGEGQIFMGALGAALVALNMPNLSKPVLLLLMLVASIVLGGLWALLSGILKVYFNTNETIITLMLNYIALKFITYLQYGPLRDKKAMNFPKIPNFSDNAILPKLFNIHIGWIFAIIIVIVFYFIMKHSKLGYEISVIGESHNTARYAGIGINKTILKAIFISGALCGIVGFIQASAVSGTLSTEITGGVGNTAIIIAWLSNLNSIVILIVSVLFAALLEGGNYIQTAFGIPNAAASVVQALILFFVLGSDLFMRYKISFRRNE
ncbi:ABC transporter permease [Clostridium sp. YIM B02505]|uniref:ABC transporter permease n=1 Tax=Clostridium yunnanense TaxID=2800325 RepID=A0ABS1EL47_9CLOT|nr:ABC transporter permease [Clostridium yunnanense]MBK1810098.1 ABC transporter permease [Clostridium yunnanense]